MKILQNSNYVVTKGLKPISEYKGPILKLTAKEKSEIAIIESKISELEVELIKLDKSWKNIKKPSDNQQDYYSDKFYSINTWIESLRKSIKEIKMQRLEKQKAALKKSGLDTEI